MPTSRDDAAVFTQIFEWRRDAVHAFVGRVADPELARDLLQETFLRVWRRLPEVGSLAGDQQRAWIFTVARNLAIDSYRAEASRRAAEAALRQAAATREATVAGPDLEAEYGERLAQLDAAIRELPEEQRVILSMATAGTDQPRDRRGPGRARRTVRYRLSQARKQLAAALDLEDAR